MKTIQVTECKYTCIDTFIYFSRADRRTCSEAALSGSLDCLKYAIENDCPTSILTIENSITGNHFDCFEYAISKKCKFTNKATELAANKYDFLSYLIKCKCPMNDKTTENASLNNNLECLKLAIDNNCPISDKCCEYAVLNGNMEMFHYLFDKKAHINEYVHANAIKTQNTELLAFIESNKSLFPFNVELCCLVVSSMCKNNEYFHNLMIDYHNKGLFFSVYILQNFAKNGNLFMLKYAKDKRYQFNESVINCAAEFGELDTLKYFHEEKYPLTSKTCAIAAMHGHLECLKYLIETCHCVFDKYASFNAAANGHFECFKYIAGTSHYIHSNSYKIAIFNKHDEIANFVIEYNATQLKNNLFHNDVNNLYGGDKYDLIVEGIEPVID